MIRPTASSSDIASKLSALYPIEVVRLKRLDGYDDLNYFVEARSKEDMSVKKYVCKVLNSEDSLKTEYIDAQHRLMEHLAKEGIKVSEPVVNVNGQYFSIETFGESKHLFRLLTFIDGAKLKDSTPCAKMYYNVGVLLGQLYSILKNYNDDVLAKRRHLWMLESVPKIIDYLHAVPSIENRELVEKIVKEFQDRAISLISELEKVISHGDLNEHNILADGSDVVGLIDLGDSCQSPVIFEIAIAMTYMSLHANDISIVRHILDGCQSYRKLTKDETNLIRICMCARLAQSLVLGCYSALKAPDNEYILSSEKQGGWALLRYLYDATDSHLKTLWGLDQ